MKSRIFGYLFVVFVLATLYVFTEGNKPSTVPQSSPSTPNDSAFKDLKIN